METANIYNIITENNKIIGIYENVRQNLKVLKEIINKKSLLNDQQKQDIQSNFLDTNKNLKDIKIIKSGYKYQNGKVVYYLLFEYSEDKLTIADIIYYNV